MRNRALAKENVLTTAEKIIVREGLEGFSMRQIASELDVAVGTLYNYYDSREALLIELFNISWKRTVNRIRSMVDSKEPRWIQLKQIFSSIQMDIEKKEGLGRDIYIFKSFDPVVQENVINLRNELQSVIADVLNQKKGQAEANGILSRWIMTVFIDALVHNRDIAEEELMMLGKIIDMKYDQ